MGGRLRWALGLVTAVLVAASAAPASASFPGGNGKIAFTGSSGAGNRVIYTIEPDGTGQQALLAEASQPSWSPDAGRIAFTAGARIEVMNADGSARMTLTDPAFLINDSDPDWSPDGNQIVFHEFIYFQEGPVSAIETIQPDGSGQQNLWYGSQPAWSPDGTRLAYVRQTVRYEEDEDGDTIEVHDYDLDLFDLATSTHASLTSGPEADFNPDWSPDGSQIAFSRDGQLHVMNSDGTGLRRLTVGSSPSWAPDGSEIAFSRSELYTIGVDGTGERRLTDPGDAISTFDADWQALPGPRRADFKNASKFCAAERDFLGEQAFRERYGGGANAHGKCVSSS